jgi:excisionase family DNA binding protein
MSSPVCYTESKYSSTLYCVERDWMRTEEVAAELGMSRWAVWKAIQTKRLAAEEFGSIYVVHRDEVERFRQNRRRPGRPKADKPAPAD